MVNEIKMDKIESYYLNDNKDQQVKSKEANPIEAQQEEAPPVAVSANLKDIIEMMSVKDESTDINRLSSIKYSVQQNQYRLDLEKLSDTLLNSGVLNAIGDE